MNYEKQIPVNPFYRWIGFRFIWIIVLITWNPYSGYHSHEYNKWAHLMFREKHCLTIAYVYLMAQCIQLWIIKSSNWYPSKLTCLYIDKYVLRTWSYYCDNCAILPLCDILLSHDNPYYIALYLWTNNYVKTMTPIQSW